MGKHKFAIVDIETTGLSPTRDRIIEVAVLQTNGLEVENTWSSLVNPERSFDPFITKITGISPHELINAPRFADLYDRLYGMLDGRVFMAHNVRFDYGFMKREFSRVGKSIHFPQLCSARLSRSLYPRHKGHGLDKIISRFSLKVDDRHRALGDAVAVLDFLKLSSKKAGKQKLEASVQKLLKKPALPKNISARVINKIPKTYGIYIFYDKDGGPLYVGKSKSLKQRISSHFYSDLRSGKEWKLKTMVHKIETEVAAGELDAQLREIELVRTLKPLMNVRLKSTKHKFVCSYDKGEHGYLTVKTRRVTKVDGELLTKPLTVFTKKTAMEKALRAVADKHDLCLKLLGLENGKGACFDYHLGKCNGACVGEEKPKKYNLRVITALEPRIKIWPYKGPIAVSEYNEANDCSAVHVFDKWCYLGRAVDGDRAEAERMDSYEFDFDYYYAVKHCLRQPGIRIREIGK